MTIEFEALADATGLRVRDDATGEQFEIRTDCAVDPASASADEFVMPVDRAVAVDAGELHFPLYGSAEFLRDGDVVHRTEDAETSERLPRTTYEVDVSPPAAKTFVKVCDATVAARYADDHLYLDVDPATRLVVGVRSHHEGPAATVTTTDDPRDLMRAVSTFGSALKTHSPDRSWPTLRGHPPALRRGDHLDVPDEAAPPDTHVTIEIPPEYGAIYGVAPLAYYLGATLEAGTTPRLRAAGAVREFDPGALADDVRTCLEHVFALDGVVRSAGVYPFRTRQADVFDDRVDIDYETLFELPLDERTAAYLDVPRTATDGLLDWHLTADIAPDPAYAPALPYLANELAVVRSPPLRAATRPLSPVDDHSADVDAPPVASGESPVDTSEPPTTSGDPATGRDAARVRSVPDASFSSSVSDAPLSPSTPGRASATDAVVPATTDTPGHVWAADGVAVGSANPTVGSYHRSFDWPNGTDPLDVHVVYNDAHIDNPEETPYDGHPTAETNVRTSHSLATTELRDALRDGADFLHFVGHVTDRGLVCPDGELDARTLAATDVGAFFLNGCRSLAQGRALLTAGSVGGIVTVDDVPDAAASTVGRQVAMLLDAGYPLYGVLDVLDAAGLDTGRYAALGNETAALRKPASGAALLYEFDTDEFDADTDPVPATSRWYPSGENGLGAMTASNFSTRDAALANASVRTDFVPRATLERHLGVTTEPLLFDGRLVRTTDLSMADFA